MSQNNPTTAKAGDADCGFPELKMQYHILKENALIAISDTEIVPIAVLIKAYRQKLRIDKFERFKIWCDGTENCPIEVYPDLVKLFVAFQSAESKPLPPTIEGEG